MDSLMYALTLTSALGCGLIAGVFFAFSAFVMRALSRLPSSQGIAAMQSINVVVLNPVFLGVFLGTGAACLLAGVWPLFAPRPGGAYVLAGSVFYLLGTVLVTGLSNVPRNEALRAVDPESPEGAALWRDYLKSWTAWNHVRTAAAFLAAASFSLAL